MSNSDFFFIALNQSLNLVVCNKKNRPISKINYDPSNKVMFHAVEIQLRKVCFLTLYILCLLYTLSCFSLHTKVSRQWTYLYVFRVWQLYLRANLVNQYAAWNSGVGGGKLFFEGQKHLFCLTMLSLKIKCAIVKLEPRWSVFVCIGVYIHALCVCIHIYIMCVYICTLSIYILMSKLDYLCHLLLY